MSNTIIGARNAFIPDGLGSGRHQYIECSIA